MKVIRQENETFESMWFRFKKQEKRERFWTEIKKRKFYVKPSVIAREARKRGKFLTMVMEKRKKR